MKKTFKILFLCSLLILESRAMDFEDIEVVRSVISNKDFLSQETPAEHDIWAKTFEIIAQDDFWLEARNGYQVTKEEIEKHFNEKRSEILRIAENAKYAKPEKLIETGKQDFSDKPEDEREMYELKQNSNLLSQMECLKKSFCFESQGNHYRDLWLAHRLILRIICAADQHIKERNVETFGFLPSKAGPEIKRHASELIAFNLGALAGKVFDNDPSIAKDPTIREKMNAAFREIMSEKCDFKTVIEKKINEEPQEF
jgi:hypothetical protein